MAKKTSREKLNKLVKKRENLKKRKEEGKTTLLGNLRRKRIQKKINKNKSAQKDLATSNSRTERNTPKTPKKNTKKTKTDFFPPPKAKRTSKIGKIRRTR